LVIIFEKMKKILIFILLSALWNCSYKIIIRHDPLSAQQHNDLGASYYKEGEFEAAEREFKASIKKDKKFWLAYYNLGTLYLYKPNYKEAEYYLYKSIIYNSTFSDGYNNLSLLMLKKGDLKHSLYYITLAIKFATTNKHLYYETLAQIQDRLNNKEAACESLKFAIDNAPLLKKDEYKLIYQKKCK